MRLQLQFVDYLIIIIYFLFVVSIGFLIKKKIKTANDYLMSSRSIPLWITSLAFISANLGAQEVIGMVASGAKYGLLTAHFYICAIPAMVFLGIFMMPFYYGSRARSVPEYLALRFDEKTRAFNAVTFAAMTVFSSGISLFALAKLLEVIVGWSFDVSILAAAGIVMVYTFLGGLTSAVYNEVLQFFLIVLGIAPLVILGLYKLGGFNGLAHHVQPQMLHIWKNLATAGDNTMGVNWWQMLSGLWFVLGFGYWCTDFLVVQRAMISRNLKAAQKTPIIAAFPKLFMPLIVILPGLIAVALQQMHGTGYALPLDTSGNPDYNMALPSLLGSIYPNGMLGVGLTALIASFMSGMAGNVTAFNTVWTFDIYQSYFNKGASDKHYLQVGKLATVFGIIASVGTAYLANSFNNIMDFLQLVFGFVNAPLFATFFLGMFWKRTTGNGAFWGLVAGTLAATITHGLTMAEGKGSWLGTTVHIFSSGMAQAFMIALIAWTICFAVTIVISLFTIPRQDKELVGLVYSLTPKAVAVPVKWYQSEKVLAIIILSLMAIVSLLLI